MKIEVKKKESLLHIFLFIALLIIVIYRITEKPGLWFADEFGYSGIGAYLGGMDWSDQIKHIGYYGVGYAVLLMPAYRFCNSARQVILYANFLNVMLILVSFELAIRFLKHILSNSIYLLIYLYAFTAVLYTNNLVQLHMDWSESLNLCLYWIILNLIMDLIINNKLRTYILLSIFLCFSVMVHMRNIGIVVAAVVVLLLHILKTRKIKIRHIILFTIVVLAGVVIFFLSKKEIQNIVWNNSEEAKVNDISKRLEYLIYAFNLNGLIGMFKSLICKYYYITASTYGLIVFGIIYTIRIIFKRKNMDISLIYLFCILSFLFPFIISVITTPYPGRVDIVLYGRYYEPCIGAMICFGLHSLTLDNSNEIIKKYCFIIASLICSTLVTHDVINSVASTFAIYPCIAGLGKYFMLGNDLQNVIFHIVLENVLYSICVVTVFVLLLKVNLKKISEKTIALSVFCIFIVCAWIKDARSVIDTMLASEVQRYENINPISERLAYDGITFNSRETLYYLCSDNETWNEYLLGLQFVLGRNKLINVEHEDWNSVLKEANSFIVMDNGYSSNDLEIIDIFQERYVPVCATEEFILYQFIDE